MDNPALTVGTVLNSVNKCFMSNKWKVLHINQRTNGNVVVHGATIAMCKSVSWINFLLFRKSVKCIVWLFSSREIWSILPHLPSAVCLWWRCSHIYKCFKTLHYSGKIFIKIIIFYWSLDYSIYLAVFCFVFFNYSDRETVWGVLFFRLNSASCSKWETFKRCMVAVQSAWRLWSNTFFLNTLNMCGFPC